EAVLGVVRAAGAGSFTFLCAPAKAIPQSVGRQNVQEVVLDALRRLDEGEALPAAANGEADVSQISSRCYKCPLFREGAPLDRAVRAGCGCGRVAVRRLAQHVVPGRDLLPDLLLH